MRRCDFLSGDRKVWELKAVNGIFPEEVKEFWESEGAREAEFHPKQEDPDGPMCTCPKEYTAREEDDAWWWFKTGWYKFRGVEMKWGN